MELSSDTIRSASVAVSSILRNEELDEILAMDWWFDSELGDNKPSKAQRRKQAIEQSSSGSARTLTREDVDQIVSSGLAGLRDDLIKASSSAAAKPVKWWQRPIGSGIVGGLVVLAVAGAVSHYLRDSTTQISDEITRQLGQRTATDAENLNNRISPEVGKQLSPIHQQIAGLSQDIGKIKDHFGIARNIPPRSAPSPPPRVDVGLRRFEQMDKKQFAMSLPALRTIIQGRPAPQDQGTLRNIAEKLRESDPRAAGYWPTVFAFITWTSAMSAKNVPPPSAKTNFLITSTPRETAHITFDGLVVSLDGGEINGLTFRNCRIRFTSNAVQMNDVRFVSCIFEFPPIQNATPYLERATRELLEADNLRSVSLTLRG